MKYLVTILCLLSGCSFAQNTLTGQVSLCKECRGAWISNKDSTGATSYLLKTSTKNGKLQTEIIRASFQLTKDNEIVSTGTTTTEGAFQIHNLESGIYNLNVVINKFLKADTTLNLRSKRTKILIEIDDKRLSDYMDSTQLAKYPYNKQKAKDDIESGQIQVLSYGLQIFSDQQLDSVTSKYGFKYVAVAGCVVDSYEAKSIENYNTEVYEYLDKRNGEGWRESLKLDTRNLYLKLMNKNER